jgi:hypothetical protein
MANRALLMPRRNITRQIPYELNLWETGYFVNAPKIRSNKKDVFREDGGYYRPDFSAITTMVDATYLTNSNLNGL